MQYQSTKTVHSHVFPHVRFTIRRVSFGRRLEFTRQVRSLGERLEYLQAGETATDKLDAALLAAEINRLYLQWGLLCTEGLCIDGEAPDTEVLIERGPETLCHEILTAIKHEFGLTEEERKN